MANLLIEIGNTALKAAWSEGMTLGKTFRYQGEKAFDFIDTLTVRDKPEVMAVASKKPVPKEVEVHLRSQCTHLILLDSGRQDMLRAYGMPAYLSYDRAAALLAARHLFAGKSCTVFDFGNTLSVDVLDASGQYAGGNISCGCRTRFKALNRYSRTLPLVDTPEDPSVMGDSLKSSIEAGIILGIMFEIEGYARQYLDNVMVFTGGDAIYFAKRMKSPIFAICNLVLMGLALITNDYVSKKNNI